MIGIVLGACLGAWASLAGTGSDLGTWFIYDHAPDAPGRPFGLCQVIGDDQWFEVLPLSQRPIAMAIDGMTIWILAPSQGGQGLYTLRLERKAASGFLEAHTPGAARLVATLDSTAPSPQLAASGEGPVVAWHDKGTLHLRRCVGGSWEALPALACRDSAQIAGVAGVLHVCDDDHAWRLEGEQWQTVATLLPGHRVWDLLARGTWPVLVREDAGDILVEGVQQGRVIPIVRLQRPQGRWGVLQAGSGLVLLGIESGGGVTARSIAWPSGDVGDPIVLGETHGTTGSPWLALATAMMFACLGLMALSARRGATRTGKS